MKIVRQYAARAALLSLALLGTSQLARAADPSPAPYVRVSIASIDAVNQFTSDLSLPMPINIQNAIEGQFPFIGSGGLDTSKPLGAIFVAGENLPQQALALFVFPMSAGKGTIPDLTTKFNATPAENTTDTVIMGGSVALKRTNDYMLMYVGDPVVLKDLGNNVFDSDYKIPGTLAHLEINGATARAAAPHMTQAFFDSLRTAGNPMGNPLSERTRLATQDFLANAIQSVDLFTLNLAKDNNDLKLTATITPTFAKGKREFAKPNLPATAIATLNIVYPDAESAGWLPRLVDKLKDDDLPVPASKLTPDQVTSERATLKSVVKVLFAPDAQSAAIENRGGKVVVTMVNQYTDGTDAIGELQKDLSAIIDLDKATGTTTEEPTAAESTAPDGSKLLTISFPHASSDGPKQMFISQNGGTAVFTISMEDTPTPTAVTLSATDKISDLLASHVDLSNVLAAAQSEGVFAMLNPDQQKLVTDGLTGKSIDVVVSSDASANLLNVTATVPTSLLKVAGVMAMSR